MGRQYGLMRAGSSREGLAGIVVLEGPRPRGPQSSLPCLDGFALLEHIAGLQADC